MSETKVSIWPGKLRAVGIHFAFSLIVFLVVMYLIITRWYPGFHFSVDGGWQGTRIMVGVDLVLGPLLTLIIFDSRKSRRAIAFDLACIGTVQIGALIWGIHAIHSQRLAGMAFLESAVYPVFVEDVVEQGGDPTAMHALSGEDPPLVYSRRAKFGTAELDRSIELARLPRESHIHLHADWASNFDRVLDTGDFNFAAAGQDFPAFDAAVADWLAEHQRSAADIHMLIYYGRYGRRMLVFDKTGRLLDHLPYYDPALADEGPPVDESKSVDKHAADDRAA